MICVLFLTQYTRKYFQYFSSNILLMLSWVNYHSHTLNCDETYWNIDNCRELFDKGLKEVFNNNIREAATRFYALRSKKWQAYKFNESGIHWQ